MTLYGDLDHVKKMIRPDDVASLGTDVDDRLETIQAAASLALEEKLGRTFGLPVSDTSEVHWIGPYDTLVLNRPARSITSIQYGGTLSGDTMTGGQTVLAADLYNVVRDPYTGFIYSIRNAKSAVWSWYADPPYYQTNDKTPVVVTADFADTDNDADVPDDITYAANLLMLRLFQLETASPAGFTGPDGATVPARDPWKDPAVKAVVDKYSIRCALAV